MVDELLPLQPQTGSPSMSNPDLARPPLRTERLRALEKNSDKDAILLDQLNRAIQGSPIGAGVSQHLRSAIEIVSKRRASGQDQLLDDIIRRLKET